jgi:hypothetical protein
MMRSVLDFIVVLPDYFLVDARARMGIAPKGWNSIRQSGR